MGGKEFERIIARDTLSRDFGRELNEFSVHSRDVIKLNERLGKDKWGVGERIIERERLSRDFAQ